MKISKTFNKKAIKYTTIAIEKHFITCTFATYSLFSIS
jgi:hypothetical protein